MANKDFLSSLTEEKKPDSFKEEERVKVEKKQSPFLKYAIIGVVVIAIISLLVYVWMVLIPHISFNDFTNKKVEEVQAFLTQNKIEAQGVVFLEEYNFDVEKGYVISQSVDGNKKIHKNEKLVFYVSKGADPNEEVNVPELETMNRKQIETWINTNKLQNVKISTTYSNDVAKDEVISVVFKNDDRYSFTRGSQVTITFSKGEQPASTLKVIDLKEQPYSAAEAFVKEKKLEIKKVETVSTSIEKGLIISTSPAANENIKEGETLTVYVSKGIAVVVPDLVGKTEKDDFAIFLKGDGKSITYHIKYVDTNDKKLDGIIKEQNIKAGTKITDEVFVITVYSYTPEGGKEPENYGKLELSDLVGKTINQAKSYVSSLVNNGITIEEDGNAISVVGYKKGQIYFASSDELVDNNYVLSKPVTIKVRISAGEIYDLVLNEGGYKNPADLIRFLSEEGFEIEYQNDATYADATSLTVNDKTVNYNEEGFSETSIRILEGQKIIISK